MSSRSRHLSSLTLTLLGLLMPLISADCPGDYAFIDRSCFEFVKEAMTVEEANTYCDTEGGTLASVASEEEKDGIINHIEANYPGRYWTSGTYSNSGLYVWGDSKTEIPDEWRGNQFSQQENMCVYVCSRTKKFWEQPCTNKHSFICKHRPIDPNVLPMAAAL